jgi:hypothetical protein
MEKNLHPSILNIILAVPVTIVSQNSAVVPFAIMSQNNDLFLLSTLLMSNVLEVFPTPTPLIPATVSVDPTDEGLSPIRLYPLQRHLQVPGLSLLPVNQGFLQLPP